MTSIETCSICNASLVNFDIWMYERHMYLHVSAKNCSFACYKSSCKASFSNVSSMRSHIRRTHPEHYQNRPSSAAETYDIERVTRMCGLTNCQKRFSNYKELIRHLKIHMNDGQEIECPVTDCQHLFNKVGSFTSHFSRKHKSYAIRPQQHTSTAIEAVDSSTEDIWPIGNNLNETQIDPVNWDVFHGNHDLCSPAALDGGVITRTLAHTLLGLESRYLVSSSATQFLVESLGACTDSINEYVSYMVQTAMKNTDVSGSEIDRLIEIFNVNNFECLQGPLSTVHLRHKYYEHEFNFVEPEKVFLGYCENILCTMYYVPLKKTLSGILQDNSVQAALSKPHFDNHSNFLFDFCDGQKFKRSHVGGELELLIFQDAFEPFNPLGSGKTKHKLVGVYGILANLPPQYRSCIDNIFLILIFKESYLKFFGHEAIFHRLMTELSQLELTGLETISGMKRCKLFALIGDNLGSHSIGGFVESFSGNYFCRYCDVKRNDFHDDPLAVGDLRTAESYNECLRILNDSPVVQNNYCGVKFDSVFNKLSSFHVCEFGLPPCLGHDLFEGVVAYDMKLMINAFEKKGWLNYEIVNECIACFKYVGCDKNDKPVLQSRKSCKLSGHAMQNWTLLRTFPILINDYIRDTDDPVWNLLMLLRKIVELVCAPIISHSQICLLEEYVHEYLVTRKEVLSVSLRPKHHYLVHYGDLIRQLGPLIRLWTMRFESKHSYFKRCVRSCQNAKNLCYTLSYRYQMYFCYMTFGNLLKPDLTFSGDDSLCFDLLSTEVKNALADAGITSDNCFCVKTAIRCGISYRESMYVILNNFVMPDILLHKIKMVLVVNGTDLHFVTTPCDAMYIDAIGLYKLGDSEIGPVHVIRATDLLEYSPVYSYNGYVALKHALPDE